jgi:hypothetical protein
MAKWRYYTCSCVIFLSVKVVQFYEGNAECAELCISNLVLAWDRNKLL